MLVTIFTLQLSVPIQPRLVTVGRYDGRHPCLTCATAGGRVFVHNPHGERSATSVAFLNINKNITSLVAGRLDTNTQSDVLLVGTPTDILAYDVAANKDVFFKELPDGVFSMCVGAIGGIPSPLVFVGGNCSIQGLNAAAEDAFWTVTGDNVCSLALCDVDGDDAPELVVGSEDFDLRAFHGDGEMIQELSLNEAVTALCTLSGRRLGFALGNGTVGVYEGTQQLWVSSRKHQVISLHAFDCNLDGVAELVTGWSDGTLDVRDPRTGKVLFSDALPAMIAGIVQADYRLDGTETLIVCSVTGEVRGYQPMGFQSRSTPSAAVPSSFSSSSSSIPSSVPPSMLPGVNSPSNSPLSSAVLSPARTPLAASAVSPMMSSLSSASLVPSDRKEDRERHVAVAKQQHRRQAQELAQKVNDLTAQLRVLESMAKGGATRGVADVPVSGAFSVVETGSGCEIVLTITAPVGSAIRAAILEGEGLFPSSRHVVCPATPSNTLTVPIRPPRSQAVKVSAQVFVSSMDNTTQSIVKEVSVTLPRFAHLRPGKQRAQGTKVSLAVPSTQLAKLNKWANENLLLSEPMSVLPPSLNLTSLQGDADTTISTEGELVIVSPDSDLVGDLVQSMAEFLSIEDLNSIADCAQEAEEFAALLSKVNDVHAARQKLSADMADNGSLVKGLIVRAEDARIQGDMEFMKSTYQQLQDVNKDLFTAYTIRCNNHAELLSCLKLVNTHIQRVSRWRVGKAKVAVVAALREAIKNNDPTALGKIVRLGAVGY